MKAVLVQTRHQLRLVLVVFGVLAAGSSYGCDEPTEKVDEAWVAQRQASVEGLDGARQLDGAGKESFGGWLVRDAADAEIFAVLGNVTPADRWLLPAVEELLQGKRGKRPAVAAAMALWKRFPDSASEISLKALDNVGQDAAVVLAKELAVSGYQDDEKVVRRLQEYCEQGLAPGAWGLLFREGEAKTSVKKVGALEIVEDASVLQVAWICSNGNAANQGLLPGDVVVSVNGVNGSDTGAFAADDVEVLVRRGSQEVPVGLHRSTAVQGPDSKN